MDIESLDEYTRGMSDDEHYPVRHRTRVVCSCGDFNCASLD
jgi:hypothetical protein